LRLICKCFPGRLLQTAGEIHTPALLVKALVHFGIFTAALQALRHPKSDACTGSAPHLRWRTESRRKTIACPIEIVYGFHDHFLCPGGQEWKKTRRVRNKAGWYPEISGSSNWLLDHRP